VKQGDVVSSCLFLIKSRFTKAALATGMNRNAVWRLEMSKATSVIYPCLATIMEKLEFKIPFGVLT
jgi:hypothetical protein